MDSAFWTVSANVAAIALYLLATLMVARQFRGVSQPGRLEVLVPGSLAVLLHGVSLWPVVVTETGLHLGLFPVASLIGVTGSAMVVISSLYRPLEWISVMVFPLSALTLIAALLMPPGQAMSHGLGLHVLLSVMAHAVFGIAAAQSILLLVQHRQLKEGHIRGVMRLFPPIQVMEVMLFELLWAGLILLTAAIGAGLLYVEDMFAQHLVHKTFFTLLAWLLFAVLLAGRHFLGWRAMTAIRMTLVGFAVLLLGFFGSQFVLEVLLQRA
jgi:ABC-type uncharacterized transport system permease subunit